MSFITKCKHQEEHGKAMWVTPFPTWFLTDKDTSFTWCYHGTRWMQLGVQACRTASCRLLSPPYPPLPWWRHGCSQTVMFACPFLLLRQSFQKGNRRLESWKSRRGGGGDKINKARLGKEQTTTFGILILGLLWRKRKKTVLKKGNLKQFYLVASKVIPMAIVMNTVVVMYNNQAKCLTW